MRPSQSCVPRVAPSIHSLPPAPTLTLPSLTLATLKLPTLTVRAPTLTVLALPQVRSTTLDIQVWEPNMIAMFEALGNEMVNMVYENRVRTSRSAAQRDDVFFSPSHHEDDGDDSSLLMSHSQVEEVLQHASPTASSHTAHSHPCAAPL